MGTYGLSTGEKHPTTQIHTRRRLVTDETFHLHDTTAGRGSLQRIASTILHFPVKLSIIIVIPKKHEITEDGLMLTPLRNKLQKIYVYVLQKQMNVHLDGYLPHILSTHSSHSQGSICPHAIYSETSIGS